MKSSALLTDFYSLTMAQGYWKMGMNRRAVFEMYFRYHPFKSGFSVFAGLGSLLEKLKTLAFSQDEILYLKELGIFEDAFLDYLKDFRFQGSVWAMEEGTVIFPVEPLIRVQGGLIECQLIEGLLLNTINFQSLVATKTARIWLASGMGSVVEFGLRRAQGPDGAMSASRAAFIGGAMATSNTLAGKEFGIPIIGTMAHSWIMAFANEEKAFQVYADMYPDSTVFLIDTYDTLKSGIVNAIKVGKTLAARGKNFGVRLDSGDIHYLSLEVRKKLNEAGLGEATISVSNDLDESIIQTLTNAKAPINTWGVGTKMVTGGEEAAFSGIYKLAASENEKGEPTAKMKFSDNPEKTTNPGVKQVWRIKDPQGICVADILALEDFNEPEASTDSECLDSGKNYSFWHPQADYRRFTHTIDGSVKPLLVQWLDKGKPVREIKKLKDIQAHLCRELQSLDQTHKRILNPHIYKVSVTEKLRALKLDLIKNYLGDT